MTTQAIEAQPIESTGIAQFNPGTLLERAVDNGAGIETIERLVALQERIMADNARREYSIAMAGLQGEMVPIIRNKANEQTRSMYADLEAVEEMLTPLKSRYGFSVSFNTDPKAEAGTIGGIAVVMHSGGHSERFTLQMPLDTVGAKGNKNKTEVHGTGSAISYLRRYLEAMIFNVVFADPSPLGDDDGQAAGAGEIEAIAKENLALKEHNACVDRNRHLLSDVWRYYDEGGAENMDLAARALAEISKKDIDIMNRAPTKGGLLFRTDERSDVKGDAELQSLITKYKNQNGWFQNPENQQ